MAATVDMAGILRETQGLEGIDLVAWAAGRFGAQAALASSLGAEDQVITNFISRLAPAPGIFSLDTGRLPQETYDTIEAVYKRYGIRIKMLFPDRQQVEAMVAERGPNLFYESVENRKLCCNVRKVVPLKRELATLKAWITGLRREQAVTRATVEPVEWDETHGLIKLNPLAKWSTDQVWDYIRKNDVPYNPLHDKGYPSIGCAPCTRAIEPGQDIRAGRWWWETPEQKECGLHVVDGRLVRAKKT